MPQGSAGLLRGTRSAAPRVLVADDDPVFRASLIEALHAAGLQVTAEARDAREAVDHAVRFRPDVAIVDLLMPGRDGILATRRIVRVVPDVRVLVMTLFPDIGLGMLALRAGAYGYLAKEAGVEAMAAAACRVSDPAWAPPRRGPRAP